jgi:hypothetical protein
MFGRHALQALSDQGRRPFGVDPRRGGKGGHAQGSEL